MLPLLVKLILDKTIEISLSARKLRLNKSRWPPPLHLKQTNARPTAAVQIIQKMRAAKAIF